MASNIGIREGKTDILRGRWHEVKDGVKDRWDQLTEDDLASMSGNQDELVSLLQLRYGYTMDQAEDEINKWLRDEDKRFNTMQKNR